MNLDGMRAWLADHGHDVESWTETTVVTRRPRDGVRRRYVQCSYAPMVGASLGSDVSYWRIEKP